MEITEYKTIKRPTSIELKIQKSLFIGHVQQTPTAETAQAFIAQIRSEHVQATHNCYAYVIGWGNRQLVHFHDHGEPSGTAGKPILGAIQRLDLTHTTVVVTRYFGGRKLGVRGLIETYGATATLALESAGIQVVPITKKYNLTVEYPNFGTVQHLISEAGAIIENENYGSLVSLTVSLPVVNADQIVHQLTERFLVRKIEETP